MTTPTRSLRFAAALSLAASLALFPASLLPRDASAQDDNDTDPTVAVIAPAPASAAATKPHPTTAAPPASLESVLAPLTEDKLFKTAKVGLQVVDVRTGEEVFARNADVGMQPASTMKVVTTAAALRTLGPAYKYATDLYVDADVKPDATGLLKGNLYVQGHGDPTMVVETMWKIVHDLKLQGVSKIDGDVVYDEGFLDTDYALPGWNKQDDIDNGPSYFPPLGALSLNYNTVGIVVAPGEVGKPARVELETSASDYVDIDDQLVTVSANSRRYVKIERELDDKTKKLKFTLTGQVPADADPDLYYRTVLDPTSYFMAAFKDMLASQGIAVTGKQKRGAAPTSGDLLLEHRSEPLAQILMEMDKHSNNFMAEQVLRTMGAESYGLPGTTDKGLHVVGDYLGSLGIDPKEYSLVNGSGLSRSVVLRPSHLTAVLVDMAHDNRVGHEFEAAMSIAGEDGTLWRRLTEDPGRLRGKTGTIDGIHCLVGYVEAADGEVYAFSFMVNDLKGDSSQVKRLHDRFARTMFTVGMNGPEVVEGEPATSREE